MRLLLELRMHPVDVFLGLSQAVPHGCKGVIGFVYDVGFLYHPDAYPGSYQRLTLQTKNLVSRSERIIAISKSVKQDLMKEYSIDASRVTVAYPGVDAQFGISVDPLVSQHPYFLFVGALKRGKNIAMLLYAFSRFLSQSEKRYDLYIVGGDYWKDPEIETVIAEKNLSKRVILMGHVPDNDLPAYYQGAAAFVSPSLHEGFCLPAAEAMACGCPVIGSTTGAMPEIIGNAGITVNPGDANAIALAMETVSSRPRTRMAMSKKGLRKAQKFSWRTFAETVFEAIQSV
jgi:glycosyltransferase involved in cell wall biosynthesis